MAGKGSTHNFRHPPIVPSFFCAPQTLRQLVIAPLIPPLFSHPEWLESSLYPSHSPHHPLPVSHNFESSSADLYFLANGKRAPYCDTIRRHVWNDIPYYTLPMSSPTTCPFTPPKRAILSYICFCQSLNHNSATRNAESDRRTDMQT